MKVQNITNDTLGWHGQRIAPGEVVEVSAPQGEAMISQHPAKFQKVEEERAVEQAPNRMQQGGRNRAS